MAVEASPASWANPRNLMLDLFRDGARAAAPEPRSLTDALDDDAVHVNPRDAILSRVGWYVGAAPVVLRLLVLPAATVVLIGVYGLRPLLPLSLVVAVLAAADALGLLRAARRKGLEPSLLSVGFALAVAANLLVAATVRAPLFSLATAVTGAYLVTTVILWTLAWGGLAGLVLVAANVPLQTAMVALNHVHDPDGVPHALAYAAAGTVGLGLAVGTALIALTVLGFGTRLAMTVGMRAGREAERANILRGMHDTVLQTLEAIALQPAGDPEQTLQQVRGMARSQVIQIRRALDELAGARPAGPQLSDELAELAGELAAAGLRVQLALGPIPDAELPAHRRRALRDAAREALRNTVKHAGVDEAVLRLDECDGRVSVIVRDHGAGFDPRARGFGLRQSICERMAEVGGWAEIWSQPGRGTRVSLHVPLDPSTPSAESA
jgi:signal transduction histidine kinase